MKSPTAPTLFVDALRRDMPSTDKKCMHPEQRQIVVRLIQKDRQQAAAAHALPSADIVTSIDNIGTTESDASKTHAEHKLSEADAGKSANAPIDAEVTALNIDAQPTGRVGGARDAAGCSSSSDRSSDSVGAAASRPLEPEETNGEHSRGGVSLRLRHSHD